MISDFRFAFRSLAKSPGFTAVAMLSLAVGIGAATAVFSVINSVLFRSLPVRSPHELRVIHWIGRHPVYNSFTGNTAAAAGGFTTSASFPYPAFRDFREHAEAFSSVFAFFPLRRITAAIDGEASTVSGLMVSGNFFEGYGAQTLIGRPLAPEDDAPGAAPATVITYGMWQRQFGLDPRALGETLTLNQHAFTIVGVLPREYAGPLPGDTSSFYVPFAAQPALVPSRPLDSPNRWWVHVMGRVAPGANDQQAQTTLTVLFRQVLSASNTKMEDPGIVIHSGAAGAELILRQQMARPMLALLAIVGLVLLIACANVAGLLLARSAAREHDFAVRAALGASRWRLIRQSLTESLLLGTFAAVGGWLLADWGSALLFPRLGFIPEVFSLNLVLDGRVLAFTIALSALTTLVFGLVPAARASRVAPLAGLKSSAGMIAPQLRFGRTLVAFQVGVSALLVVGAGLTLRTLINLVRLDPGFDPENVLVFRLNPAQAGYSGAALITLLDDVRRSVAAIPGVRSVALSTLPHVGTGSEVNGIELPGRPPPEPGESRQTSLFVVSEGFLDTMGIPVLLGRDLAPSDVAGATSAAVVNETFARRFFPDENPLGRAFVMSDGRGRAYTIVGICRDAKYAEIQAPVPPVAYFSHRQLERGAIYVVIRSAVPPLSLVPAARKSIAALDRKLPLSSISTQEDLLDQSIGHVKLFGGMGGGMAVVALSLAGLGLYGLFSYTVARRTREIGVRLALGAGRRVVAKAVVWEALRLAGGGLAGGVPAALGLAQLARSQLYEVSPADPATLIMSAAVLLAAVIAAAWLPARRAARVDPLTALRAE